MAVSDERNSDGASPEFEVASPYAEARAEDAVRPAVSEDPAVDDAHLAESIRTGVEPENFATRLMVNIILGTLAALTLALVVVVFWVRIWYQEQGTAQAAAATYPGMQENRIEAARVLESYGVISEEDGIYRIPIERAMDLIADEAYAARQEGANP